MLGIYSVHCLNTVQPWSVQRWKISYQNIIFYRVDYAKKGDKVHAIYDGSVKIKANQADFGGEFRIDDQLFEQQRDGEAGRELKALLKLNSEKYPLKFEVTGKRTTAENRLSASFCTEGDEDCKTAELAHKAFNTEAKTGYELSAISKTVSQGREVRDGLVVKTLRQGNANYEHSVKFQLTDLDEHVQELGYKLYRNTGIPQPKSGIEIYLPSRELEVLYTKKETDVNEYLVEAWVDKLRKPEDKLSLSVVSTKNNEEYTILLKHPSLKEVWIGLQ